MQLRYLVDVTYAFCLHIVFIDVEGKYYISCQVYLEYMERPMSMKWRKERRLMSGDSGRISVWYPLARYAIYSSNHGFVHYFELFAVLKRVLLKMLYVLID